MPDDDNAGPPNVGDAGLPNPAKALLNASEGFDASSAVKATINLNIDVDKLTQAQLARLLEFLATLDNSPAAAIGAGIGK